MDNYFFDILEDAYRKENALMGTKTFKISVKINNLCDSIKHGYFCNFIKEEFRNLRVSRFNNVNCNSNFNYGEYPQSNIKIVVYTCVTDGYDNPKPPLFTIPNVDYILFSDKHDDIEGWQIRQIPDDIAKLGNGTLINRYLKMHPSIFENFYDYAIYIDGNIQVRSNIRNIINAVSPITGLAIHRHSLRNCIYDEFRACKIFKKGNISKLKTQIDFYKAQGFPKQYGLYECTVIVSNLHNNICIELLNDWWHEFLNNDSMRDQISLPYIVWTKGYKFDDIGNLGYNVKMNPKFKYVLHNSNNAYFCALSSLKYR